jgi:hypothetical protein
VFRNPLARMTLAVVAACVLAAGCGSAAATNGTAPTAAGVVPSAPIAATASAASSARTSPGASPSASTQPTLGTSPAGAFPFAPDDLVAYYAGQGYSCTSAKPSTKAAGYSFRTCQRVDAAGRTLVVGVVTDAQNHLGDAFASVQAAGGETFLAPTDAMEPLSGFLGVTLGEDQGTAMLPWLAEHLGDEYAQTNAGGTSVATYLASADDHSKLFVEVANPAYLEASAAPQ